MDNSTLLFAALVAAGVVVILLILIQTLRSRQLRNRFGPEYKTTVDKYHDTRRAEAELAQRAERVSKFNIRPLTPEEHERFAEDWHTAQSHFVDEPSEAVTEADGLVNRVMQVRGYPVADSDQRAADISVDHSNMVNEYRHAREIETANVKGEASTEDLRQAMVSYRSLFEELVNDTQPAPKMKKEMAK